MSTTKVSTQKVIAVLRSAKLTIDSGRMGTSGLQVSGVYNDHEFVEVTYSPSRHCKNWTETTITQLAAAGDALVKSGINVLMRVAKDNNVTRLYVPKLGSYNGSTLVPFDSEIFVSMYQDEITEEKIRLAEEEQAANEKKMAAQEKFNQLVARAKKMNPVIAWDAEFGNDLRVCHVTLLNGTVAVLTVATYHSKELDWSASPMSEYNAIKIELSATYKSHWDPTRWDNRRDTITCGKDETVDDAIWAWIANIAR